MRRLLFVLVALGLAPASYAAQEKTKPLPERLAWVGLFNGELVHWLDNANRLDELCPDRRDAALWDQCRAAHMEPKVAVIPIRTAPETDATRLGELVLLAAPGRELRASVSANGRVQTFTPDLHLADWGYGPPYFHQTILMQRGSWFRVPLPVIGVGWIDADDWSQREELFGQERLDTHIEVPGEGAIIVTPRGDMVVLGVDDRGLRARPEQEADLWCEAGEPPAMAPWQELQLPFEDLFDSEGHLLITYKYMKGC